MPQFDTIIKNGTIIDGTRVPRYRADLGIKNGKIANIDRLERMPLGINLSQLFPISPVVAYVMGGFDEAKKRFPNEKEMGEILQHFHGAMAAGTVGWSTQRLISRGALQRDYDGTPMIS